MNEAVSSREHSVHCRARSPETLKNFLLHCGALRSGFVDVTQFDQIILVGPHYGSDNHIDDARDRLNKPRHSDAEFYWQLGGERPTSKI